MPGFVARADGWRLGERAAGGGLAMKTIEYLRDPILMPLFLPGILTALAMALMCSCLGVLVVLKRLSFIGQGISHAAFGGMGIAAILGLTASGASATGQFAVVVSFCLASALVIARLSNRGSTSADTAIGIVLVASMCLGAILLHVSTQRGGASQGAGWESILFGSIYGVTDSQAALAMGVTAAVMLALWWFRRGVVFWAFDEQAAPAFGVRTGAMRLVLLVLLCLAIVTSMKVAGVVLATAMLVLPAATALCLSLRFWRVLSLSVLAGVVGTAAGVVASMELDWPPGPSVVAVLTLLFAMARAYETLIRAFRSERGSAAPHRIRTGLS
jgi:ABC-type Mn2+/Zn2+ transport system permease subunit